MNSTKSKSALLWVIIVAIASTGIFVYLIRTDKPSTQPLMELSYFADEQDVALHIGKNLDPNIKQNIYYWLGVEPQKPEHIGIVSQLIKKIKKEHPIQKIIVDQELDLKKDTLMQLGYTDIISVKENLFELGEKLQEFEDTGVSYILVSASIYTNSFLKKNPLSLLKVKNKIDPLSVSFSYLPMEARDEKNMLFQCRTEDQTGTSDWGCVIVNKARFARKKLYKTLAPSGQKAWLALMDSTEKKDFILMLRKN